MLSIYPDGLLYCLLWSWHISLNWNLDVLSFDLDKIIFFIHDSLRAMHSYIYLSCKFVKNTVFFFIFPVNGGRVGVVELEHFCGMRSKKNGFEINFEHSEAKNTTEECLYYKDIRSCIKNLLFWHWNRDNISKHLTEVYLAPIFGNLIHISDWVFMAKIWSGSDRRSGYTLEATSPSSAVFSALWHKSCYSAVSFHHKSMVSKILPSNFFSLTFLVVPSM